MKKLYIRVITWVLSLLMICSIPIDALAALNSTSSNDIPNSAFQKRTGAADGGLSGLKYYVYSPVKSSSDTTEYPVMIWLHGLEASNHNADYAPLEASDVKYFASDEYQSQFPEGGCYIVVPQCPEPGTYYVNEWGWMTDSTGNNCAGTSGSRSKYIGVLNKAIDYVLANDQVNLSKVYVGGYSMGGGMTWQALISRPNQYAAAYPICPAYIPTTSELQTLADVNIWMISGTQDPVVSYNTYVSPVFNNLKNVTRADVRLTSLAQVKNSDGSVAANQHFAWVAVTANMVYDNGTPYDSNYPGTFISWLGSKSRSDSSKTAFPTASPAAGSYQSSQSITLSSNTQGSVIYYTTNNSTPTTSSTVYTGPIIVNSTTTIKAMAVASGLENSDVSEFTYTITSAPETSVIRVEGESAIVTGTPSYGNSFIENRSASSGGAHLANMSRIGNTAYWTINVPKSGNYKLLLNLAGTGNWPASLDSQISFKADNTTVSLTGTLNSANGNYYNFADYGPFTLNLAAGTHTLAMTSKGSSVPNMDYFLLTYVETDSIKIEAETAEVTGLPSYGTTFVENRSVSSGGAHLAFMSRIGNTASWEVNVPAAGDYKLTLNLAGTGQWAAALNSQISLKADNIPINLTGTLNAAGNNYYNFSNYGPFTVNLTAGTHTITMTALGTSVPNVDYLLLTK